tara:strand:+ start:597 stop:800 length:204 start_codon:yes stop_codon:yes gene_type:complete
MKKENKIKQRSSNPIHLLSKECSKSFRMLRNGRDGKIELKPTQVWCAESIIRLNVEIDPTNPNKQKE